MLKRYPLARFPLARYPLALLAALSLLAVTVAAWAQTRPDRDPIDVQVVNGQIVVQEEEARTSADQGGLVWRVVTPGYRFTDPPVSLPAVFVGIGQGGQMHAPDEWYLIDAKNPKLAGIDRQALFYAEFLFALANEKP